ncbi:MAG: TIGR00730 family Rossman fold protein [Rhodospirillales bacterium]|nr:TIGR00730 family Rossman fold protein [Rhodospirillales bacterium]
MESIKTICVYCGRAFGVNNAYKNAAAALGKILAAEKINLVCGGNVGVMGEISASVVDAKGTVTVVIPEDLQRRELAHSQSGVSEFVVVKSMHERKITMFKRSDAFVILPGGLGTLDEFFELLTWRQLDFHHKPIVLANIAGYWDPLLGLLDHLAAHEFIGPEDRKLFAVADRVEEILPLLQQTKTETTKETPHTM